jgi:RNA polymerase sigma factor (TIGR02999 family)
LAPLLEANWLVLADRERAQAISGQQTEGRRRVLSGEIRLARRIAVAGKDKMSDCDHKVTELLKEWCNGNKAALGQLTPIVFDELHRIASMYMARESHRSVLQTTALVNEAYVRIVDCTAVSWQNRAHFFAICARIMRQLLVDLARTRGYAKRGGGTRTLSLEEVGPVSRKRRIDLVALDDALTSLAEVDPRKSQIVEMRFFGGLSVEETAEVLKVSDRTVKREWRLAKEWLAKVLVPPTRNENS